MSFRKTDHISYRKPGANRLEDGVLVIPLRQTWEGKFSFRSSDGTIIRDVPIDSAEWTAGHLWQIGTAVGLHTRYPWYTRSPEILAMIQLRIRFEEEESPIPPPAETEDERRARTARETAREARRQALRDTIEKATSELADLREALFVVKPSVVTILRRYETDLVEFLQLHNLRLRVFGE
jgi:hypothetical protein